MPTRATQGVFRSQLVDPERAASARPHVPKADRVGVIFVHGIGSQKPGETLLQWSSPLIEAITAWRGWAPGSGGRTFPDATPGDPSDPVIDAAIDLQSSLPTITLGIPATTLGDERFPATEWVMTEAWWASKVSPPGLSTMTSWLGPGGAAGRIVDAIVANRASGDGILRLARPFLIPFVTVLAAIILTGYSLVRTVIAAIPIQSIKDAAILQVFDEFLIGWFGDVRVLLYDPAQSANIRAGLADAVRRLRKTCDRVVVMAHSGGVMVSYLTLTDPALVADAQVDKLITFGEGWNLALQLTDDMTGMADRLRVDLMIRQPNLRWHDFYASNDPAAAGALRTDETTPPMTDDPRIRSTLVWNRRSLIGDHGGYFDNDEEFTIPVLREIDAAGGWGEGSRFYRPDPPSAAPPAPVEAATDDLPAEPRNRRHHQRIAYLALWRHLVIALTVTTVAAALRFAPDRLVAIGSTIQGWLPQGLPWLPGVIDSVKDVGRVSTPLSDAVNVVGIGVLQAIVLISALYLAAAVPQAYLAWPKGSPLRVAMASAELAGTVVVLVSVVLVFLPGDDRLLGSGRLWWPGFLVTAGTLIVTYVGTRVASTLRVPVIANLYAFIASAIFLYALACAVLAIARSDALIASEFAYAAIWVVAYVLTAAGTARWNAWDRVERRIAHGPVGALPVDRRPVIFTSIGFSLIAACLMGVVIVGPTTVVAWIGGAGLALVLTGMLVGAYLWRSSGNPVTSLGPVERGGV
jgi:hypothetical protein